MLAFQAVAAGDSTRDLITLNGVGLKNTIYEASIELRALLGQVITELLSAGNTVTPEKLIQALHQLSQNEIDTDTRRDCMQLIQHLMRKMH